GKVRGTTSVSAAYPAFLFGDQRLRGDDPTRLAYLFPAELVAASVRVPGVSDRVVPGRPRRAALATMDAKAGTCSTPRAPGGSASRKSTKPAAIGTAFVTRVAMPAAVSALPCWNAAWSTLVPAA